MLLGTAAYMSPEQIKRRAADKRSDVWAFGCVLYEMLTGSRAFDGEDVTDTLAQVLRGEPDWSRLPIDTPPRLRTLLQRCLEKDRLRRLRDIGDVRLELENDRTALTEPGGPMSSRDTRLPLWLRRALLLGTGAALALAGAASWPSNQRSPALPEVRRFLLTNAIGVDIDDLTNAAVSPDGRTVALTGRVEGRRGVFIHSLRDGTTREVPGTTTNTQTRVIWSRDGAWLALNIGGELRRVALDGRTQTLGRLAGPFGGSWALSGEILYSANLQIVAASSSTGEQRLVLNADSDRLPWGNPQVLPGGKLFLTHKVYAPNEDIYLGGTDGSTPPAVIPARGSYPVFAPPDHLLAVRQGQLVRWRFDPTERTLGEPSILMSGLRMRSGTSTVPFSVSDNGVLVALEERYATPPSLSWFDRKGARTGSLSLTRPCRNPELSPDGTRVAMECFEVSGNRDIWLYDLARDAAQRFTTTPSDDADPVWSPDGSRVVFASTERGAADVFVKRAGGAAKETLLLETDGSTPTMAWSPDAKHIAVQLPGLGFATFDAAAPGALTRFESDSATYYETQFAPNGRFVSYGSIESGRAEVFVQPWPPTGEKIPVSVGGGTDARWNPMGNEIFYLSPDRKLMSVSMKTVGTRVEAGTPVPLFQTRIAGPLGTGHRFPYAVSRDGQRFLMYAEESASTAAITVILNWPSLLPE